MKTVLYLTPDFLVWCLPGRDGAMNCLLPNAGEPPLENLNLPGIGSVGLSCDRAEPPVGSARPVELRSLFDHGNVRPDGVEMAEAGWFRRGSLPPLPGPVSIARKMIDAWRSERPRRPRE